jgi:hypothetical protein
MMRKHQVQEVQRRPTAGLQRVHKARHALRPTFEARKQRLRDTVTAEDPPGRTGVTFVELLAEVVEQLALVAAGYDTILPELDRAPGKVADA